MAHNKQHTKPIKVTELASYGKAFDHMPTKALFLQMRIMLSALIAKFGVLGTLSFIIKVISTQKRLKKEYAQTVKTRFANIPASAITELYMMTSMYLVLAEMEDKDKAYDFVKGIFQQIGPTAHEALYKIDDLLKCEGDVFTNFCQLNRSIWENSTEKGLYEIAETQDTDKMQYFKVTRCLNVDAFSALGCPELARLGCDGDIAGYAPDAMGNKVNLDFRRPCTMAKGCATCEFYYFRQGHAPAEMETM